MENPEYRTMRFRVRGAHLGGILDGCNGGSDTGCPMPIAGWDIGCPRVYHGHLVSNPDPRLWAKEGRGLVWPTHETSGQADKRT